MNTVYIHTATGQCHIVDMVLYREVLDLAGSTLLGRKLGKRDKERLETLSELRAVS